MGPNYSPLSILISLAIAGDGTSRMLKQGRGREGLFFLHHEDPCGVLLVPAEEPDLLHHRIPSV